MKLSAAGKDGAELRILINGRFMMRYFLAPIAAIAIFLPCTSSMADDLEAILLVEMPAFTCIDGCIQLDATESTGSIETVGWDFNNDGTDDRVGDWETWNYPCIKWSDYGFGGGEYTVKLTVWDDAEPPNSDYTTVSTIYIGEPIWLADLSYWPRYGYVVFDASETEPSSKAVEYAWDYDYTGTFSADEYGIQVQEDFDEGTHPIMLRVKYYVAPNNYYCYKYGEIVLE